VNTTGWIVLAAATVFLLVFSWFSSLREKRLHGLPRFFAFETVVVLILLNQRVWFRNPFSLLQILSWLFLLASIAVVAAGFLALVKFGKPKDGNFEKTTELVDRGIYRFIRHPMYASLLYLGVGAFLKGMRTATAVLLAVNLAACWITARIEEGEMKRKFGPAYSDYMKRTKRFVPFIV
jgi:protein-S-isoprenylcysteine O-methyltransferase Ste14